MAGCAGSCSKAEIEEELARKVVVTIDNKSNITTVKSGIHKFMCDETTKWGGENREPDPFDYVLGGLGSCILTTIKQFTKKHFIPLKEVYVELFYHYDVNNQNYIIKKELTVKGDLSEEELDRLVLISDSPVQKMLNQGVEINTVLKTT